MKDYLILNDRQIGIQDAQTMLKSPVAEWEKDIYQFLLDWWSPEEFVEVKTSGSTGNPKWIKIPKTRMIASAKMTGQYFNFKENQSVILCLPAQYIAGKMMLVRALTWNLKVDAIEPKLNLSVPNKAYAFCAMTPPQINASLKSVHPIEKILLGGAPVGTELETKLASLPSKFFVSYGMTETVSHIAIRNIQTDPLDTYSALDNVSFSLHQDNQLVIHAPHLLPHPLTTTDCVDLIGSSKFKWKGRADFVINSGGLKISPEEIESQIASTVNAPFFIHGKRDEHWGHIPVLIIESSPFDTKKLMSQLQLITDKNKAPKEVYFLDKFILTQNGKLNRLATSNLLKL